MRGKSLEILEKGVAELGIRLDEEQKSQFALYLQELKEWNKKINLTAIKDDRGIIVKHFLDSLSCLKAEKIKRGLFLVDLGSGAGFPGLPLKIVSPSLRVTLVESSKKKIQFLSWTIKKLGLMDVVVVCDRVEKFGREEAARESYDLAVARAVGSLSTLAEYALPLLKLGGYFIAQKSRTAKEEITQAEPAIQILGGRIEKIIPVKVPFLEAARHLILMKKIHFTPKEYPRRVGMPSKRPLGLPIKSEKDFCFPPRR